MIHCIKMLKVNPIWQTMMIFVAIYTIALSALRESLDFAVSGIKDQHCFRYNRHHKHMCVVFSESDTFTTEFVQYFVEDLLPHGYKLPNSHYAAAKSIEGYDCTTTSFMHV